MKWSVKNGLKGRARRRKTGGRGLARHVIGVGGGIWVCNGLVLEMPDAQMFGRLWLSKSFAQAHGQSIFLSSHSQVMPVSISSIQILEMSTAAIMKPDSIELIESSPLHGIKREELV